MYFDLQFSYYCLTFKYKILIVYVTRLNPLVKNYEYKNKKLRIVLYDDYYLFMWCCLCWILDI